MQVPIILFIAASFAIAALVHPEQLALVLALAVYGVLMGPVLWRGRRGRQL
jgi:hypothetical protein